MREQHRAGRLGFLVGAGLSVPIGLPGWAAFNEALLENAIGRHAPGGTSQARALSRAYLDLLQGQSLAAVDLVRQRVGADFHVVLRGALYEREQLRKFQPTEVHYALAELALDSQPPYPCLHTTNYDDLLELTIANMLGKRPRAVHATRRSSADGPRVVHLHGYFPYDFPGAAEEKRLAAELVASDLDYHRLSNDHAAWTNRELMTLLDSRSVLVVGMSLTDPNVRRLLAYLSEHKKSHDEAHDHFVILQQRPHDARRASISAPRELLEDDEYKFWHGQGVKILRLVVVGRAQLSVAADSLHRRGMGSPPQGAAHPVGERELSRRRLRRSDAAGVRHGAPRLPSRSHRRRRRACRGASRSTCSCRCSTANIGARCRRCRGARSRRRACSRRKHDAQTIPEVELALTVGETLKRTRARSRASRRRPGEPPFQDWYHSLVSVPYFDYPAGGIPVALLQLVSADPTLAEAQTAEPDDGGAAHAHARGDHRRRAPLARRSRRAT